VSLIRTRDGTGHAGLAYVDFEDQHYALIALEDGALEIGRWVRIEPVRERGE
jgi:hypothetical protein